MPNLIIQRYLDFTTIIWVCNYIAGNMCTFKETVQIDFMQSYKKFTLQNLKTILQTFKWRFEKEWFSFSSKLSDKQNICNFSYFSFERHQNRCFYSRVFLQWQLWTVKSLSNNISDENIKTGVSIEMIFQK